MSWKTLLETRLRYDNHGLLLFSCYVSFKLVASLGALASSPMPLFVYAYGLYSPKIHGYYTEAAVYTEYKTLH